jgi:Transglycosylase-like domain
MTASPVPWTKKKSRLFLIAAVALAALAVFSDPVSAGSGGIGSTRNADDPSVTTSSAGRYERIWSRLGPGERRWANRTSSCESGRNPRAIGGGGRYRGAFQFLRSTWQASPRSPGGDPIAFPYVTQAVVAVLLMRRDGRGHWPVCG